MPEVISDDERLNRAVKSLRNMIRDKKELNRLLGSRFETGDDEMKQAVMAALLDWNQTPPLIGFVSLTNHPNKMLLIQCAAVMALRGAGIWHSREHMPSADGGTSADDHAKANEYSGWIEQLYNDYEKKKAELKLAMNIAAALGNQSLPSEYGAWTFVYGTWW